MIYVFVVVLLLRHILLTAEILLSSLGKKDHWRTKISTLWDHHGSLCLAWSLSLTRWTGLGIKRVAIRAMLIQLGLRLLPANVFLHEREMDKMGNRLAKQSEIRDLCLQGPVPTATSQIKLLHSTGGLYVSQQSAGLQLDECRWTNSDVCQSWWTAFPRSWTFNMKRPTTLSSPSSCYCLHTPWSRLKRCTMYLCIFVC